MAKSTDLQQALALRKQNPNLTTADAVAQVRASSNPMPVAPTWGATIPIAPTVTQPVQPIQQTQPPIAQAGDTVTWVNGEKFVQANNVDMTQVPIQPIGQEIPKVTPKPLDNTPIKAQETPKAPTVDFNVSQGREWDIQKNVTDITTTNPTLLKDRQAYDKAFWYATADEGKKAILDSNFKGGQPIEDSNAIFANLRAGVSVPTSNSQEYRTAQARLNTFKKFSTFDVASLSTALSGWDLLMGTQAYNDLVSDPAMKAKIEKAQLYTSGKINAEVIGNKQGAYILSNSPTVANALADGFMSQDEYNQLTNNAEVSAQAKIMWEKKTDYETKKAQYDAVEDDVDKEFAWKETTDSFKAKIAADRRKGMYKDLTIATIEYQNAMGTYTELKNSSTQLLETNMKLYETRRAEEAKIASELRQNQMNRENMVFQADLWLQTKQAEFEQGLAQQAQLASDPVSAVKATLKTFSDLGILADRSEAEIIADVQSKVASGIPLGTAISDLQTAFKSKPQYQKALELNMGQLSDAQKLGASQAFDLKKMWIEQNFQMAMAQAKQTNNNKWTKLDDWLYTNENGEIITADELKSAKLMGNNYITKQVGEQWGDCGFYASRGTWMSSTPWGNSKEERVKQFSDTTPQVGWMAFFGGAGYDKTYWHVAIVTGVNADWTINVKESNYWNDKRVTERTVPASSVTGYYNNTPLAQWVQWETQTPQYTDDVIAVLALAWDMTNTAEAKKTLKENGLTTQDLARFKAGTIPATAGQKTQAINVVNQINDMLVWDSLSDAVGTAKTPWFIPWTQRKDFEAKFASFRDNLALSNIDKLKWAMSDKDIEFLRNTASSLNLDMSEPEFIKQLNGIKQKYANIALWSPVNNTSTNTPAHIFDKEALKARIKATFQPK